MVLFVTVSIITICNECHYAECRVSFIVMLSAIMMSVVMLSAIMMSVVMVNLIMLNVVAAPVTLASMLVIVCTSS
jgi:hypothetical protein